MLMCSSAVNRRYSGISWARKPTSASQAGSWRGVPPSTDISPAVGRASPDSSRSSVVLPAPFGPISAHMRPSGTVTSQSLSAVTRRNCLTSPRVWMTVVMRSPPGVLPAA